MIICPDTSPRGLDLPSEHESYDFGSGAGFYVNAKTEEYQNHYNMYDYINIEIVKLLKEEFKVNNISNDEIIINIFTNVYKNLLITNGNIINNI